MTRESLGAVLAEPQLRFPENGPVSGWDVQATSAPSPRGGDCLVSRQELEMLLRESETEKEKGYRNLFAGVAACGAFGTVSTVTAHYGELFKTGMHPLESAFLILMVSATMASTALAVFFHGRVRKAETGAARRVIAQGFADQLELASDPDDPRHWP